MKLKTLAIQLNVDVEFAGVITDRAYLFNAIKESDIYVIPSHTEGMPRSLLEAMAVGVPCIGTSVGGIPEVLEKKSLVLPKKPRDLSALINEISDSESMRISMARRNLLFIQKNYSLKAMRLLKNSFWGELYK